MSKFLLLLTISIIPYAAYAQDSDDTTLLGIESVEDRADTITVTANGLGTDIGNTGQAVTIIEREEIESVQGPDVTRVLQRTPGLSLTRNGGVGGFTGVSIRGANSEQLLVLVDGVEVNDPSSPSGGFDFGNLLLGTAGKFDILRGSNSTIWGSDAIGGVVDVSTRAETGLEGNVEYGSRDTLYASAVGGLKGDRYFAGLTGSFYRTDGFSAAASGTEPDGFEQVAVGGTAFFDITTNLELFAHANWSEGTLDIDGFPPPTFALADTLETQGARRHWGDVGLAYYGNDLTLRAAYSLSDTERDNLDDAGNVTFAGDGHSERVQLRGEYRAIGPVTVAFGAEHEWSDYVTSFDAPGEIEISGAYVQLGFALGDIAAHIGSRVDDHELFGTNGSYGADLSYGLGNDWRIRASVGEGFKAPTLYQLRSFYGNAELRPEESTSFDLGVEKGQRGRGAHVALTAFRRDTTDLINFAFSAARPFGFYDNTARARAQGVEAEAGFDVTGALRVSGVFSYVDAEDRATGLDLARRPRHFGTLYADWDAPFALKLGADLRFAGESFDDAANSIALGGYEVFDLRAGLPLGETVEVYGRVENVFDADYATARAYASPGRGAFVGVRAQM